MKKFLFPLTLTAGLLIMNTCMQAQYKTAFTQNIISISDHLAKTEIADKVVKKFAKSFPMVSSQEWAPTADGYLVSFTSGGIENRAFLTKKGNCVHLLRYFSGKELPADVYKLVRSNYFDHEITFVTEVNTNNKTAYLVTIEDKTTMKIIKVVDNEMEVSAEYNKDLK